LGLVFQPAEEGPGNEIDGYVHPRGFGGGQYLREKGVYKNIPLIVSCHLDTSLSNGQVRITAEQATAAAYRFTIVAKGKSAHAALPWQGINPVEGVHDILGALFDLNVEFKQLAASTTGEYGLVTPSQVHTMECELNSLAPEAKIRGISRISGEKSLLMFNHFMDKYDAVIELEAPPVFNSPELAALATDVAQSIGYNVRTDPARFRDETAWAGPLTKPWVNSPERYERGCDSILHFFSPSYNPASGGLHSDDFRPDFDKASEAQINMLFGIVKRLQ
ncbi:MAG: M20 family metallopeptidase, partial [Psychrosphaera sp.]|nr:M20 family metallopeptidase [Psychrosphaera sp.]